MKDREAWLGLTVEEALEPDWPICDPHHHFWELPGSRYLLEEFGRDIGGGHRIVSTVFVECLQKYRPSGPVALQPVGETEFVDRLVAGQAGGGTAMAAGIVGYADLALGSAVRQVLEAHLQASERFRGIRHATAWHESDQVHNAHTRPPRGLMGEPRFREGFACLEELGLSFDAWLYHPQIPELAELAQAFPGVTIILNHMAGPLGIGPYAERRDEVFREWRKAMASLARHDNVYVKLGGRAMTMSGFGWHKRPAPPGSRELAEKMSPYVSSCIEQFGTHRCMFESNFPVDKASCSYTSLWNAFKRMTRDLTDQERGDLFIGTATRVYRI
jgi:predicted TIM-barrel fold metal-dependent hydrolase